MQSFLTRPPVQALLSLVLLCLVLALGAYAYQALTFAKQGGIGPTTISAVGVGEVFAAPDIGQFSFSVRAEGDEASTAQNQSAEAINTILGYLNEEGVEDRDIKTQHYNLSPRYRYEERICPTNSFCPPGNQVLDGYEVTQTVMVKVRDLDRAGELISGAGSRGATNVSSLSFTIDDETALKAEARAAAIADAKQQAEQTARDLGVRLVRMVDYSESGAGDGLPYGGMLDMAVRTESMMSAPSLPTGESTIVSRVSIQYEVR